MSLELLLTNVYEEFIKILGTFDTMIFTFVQLKKNNYKLFHILVYNRCPIENIPIYSLGLYIVPLVFFI